jgi:hypothetical protein
LLILMAISADRRRLPVMMSEMVCCEQPAASAKSACVPAILTASLMAVSVDFTCFRSVIRISYPKFGTGSSVNLRVESGMNDA